MMLIISQITEMDQERQRVILIPYRCDIIIKAIRIDGNMESAQQLQNSLKKSVKITGNIVLQRIGGRGHPSIGFKLFHDDSFHKLLPT